MSASTQGVTESPETTDAATPGALWRRALARAADAATVVLVLWMLVVLQVLWFMDDATRRFDPEPWGRAFVPLLAFIALSAIYEIVFLRFNEGQTPGKDYFHVRVVHRSGDTELSVVRIAARWLLPGLALLVSPLWLGVLAVLATGVTTPLDARRPTVHDLVAGTRVVHHRRDDDLDDDDDVDDDDEENGRLDIADPDVAGHSIMMEVLLGGRRRPERRRRKPR